MITEQNPTMNTFTVTYSQSINRLHLPPKAKQQTKPPKMTEEGNNQQEKQNPTINTFTYIKYSQSVNRLHPPPKAKQQTKPP